MIDQLVEKCSEKIDENEMIIIVVFVHYALYYFLYF